MKTRALTGRLMILACTVAPIACVSTASPPVDRQPVVVEPWGPRDEPFYDSLATYGEWVHVSGPGWVWSPYAMPAGWQPYRAGHWVLTDYGWTWASDEQFGWVVYHYGRWHVDARYGWVWVPGTEWGPAWVAWHEGGGWVGWAPLPWQVRWRAAGGLDWGGLDIRVALAPSSWCFVPARHVIDPRLSTHVAPVGRNVTLIRNTVHVTNYTFIGNRIVNQSLKPDKIGRAAGRAIRRYPLESADTPDAPRGGKVQGGKFVVYRSDAGRGEAKAPPPRETIEPAPAAGGPRAHPPRAGRRPRPESQGQPSPARPGPPREPAPAAPSAPAPAMESSSPPPAEPPARVEQPGEARRTPPGRTRGRGGSDPASKPEKPKGKKSNSGEAGCDKEKSEDCPGAGKD